MKSSVLFTEEKEEVEKGLELLQSFFIKTKYFIIGYLLLDFDIFIQHYQVQLPQLILKHLQNLQN